MTHRPLGQKCNCGQRGWMPNVEHIPIKWQRPGWITSRQGQMKPVIVMDHIMQGYLSTIVRWASDGESPIITHFGISRTGRTVQFQDIYTPGRHCTVVNSPTAERVKARTHLLYGANLYSIAIEHEGFSVNPGYSFDYLYSSSRPWPKPMVDASIQVKQYCFDNATDLGRPDRQSIIGHYEADARNRPHDPAPSNARHVWPVTHMIANVKYGETSVSNGYIVQQGDTLWSVSQKLGVSTQELVRLNKITNPNTLYRGQTLRWDDSTPFPNEELLERVEATQKAFDRVREVSG